MRSTSMSGGVVTGGKQGGGTKVPAPPAPVCGGGWGIQAGRSRVAPPEEVGTSPQEYGSTCAIVRTGPRVLVSFTFRNVRPWGLRTDPGRETGARADTFDDGKKDDGAARRGFLFPAVRRRPDATAVATRAAVIPAEGGRGIHHRSVRGSSREGPRRRGRGCGRGEDSDSTSREVLFDRARF